MKVIISGGGTGGHVYPAIAIAQELKQQFSDIEILFVGAEGKIEMDKVPKAGFKIEGLFIRGFARKLSFENIKNIFRLFKAVSKANKIVSEFKPDVAVGFGGYASGPTLYTAQRKGVKTLLQEQNSFPGITNKFLAKRANKICVAYFGLDKFFQKDKLILTGNPVRSDIWENKESRQSAYKHFKLDPNKKTILLFGGSLGARTLNRAVRDSFKLVSEKTDVQMIWQMGKLYEEEYMKVDAAKTENIHPMTFIDRMDLAYLAADIIICRAGALSISELALVKKPVILVPSPNVAEDHQTKNAMALVNEGAAFLVKDAHAKEKMLSTAISLLSNDGKQKELSDNIAKFAKPDAAKTIVKEITKLINGAS